MDDERNFAFNPYERPHAFLELFCACCLPENRIKASFEHESVHFWLDYLKFLYEPDIGMTGDS